MRAVVAFALVVAGCASNIANLEDQPLFAAGWSGPGPHVGYALTGSNASAAQQERCIAAVTRAGAVVDDKARVQALITVDHAGNRLQVTSQRYGLVRDEAKPGWPVERLCNDALIAMVNVIRAEAPREQRTAIPAPQANDHWHRPHTGPFDELPTPEPPATYPTSSGSPNRGPIGP